VAYFKRPKWGSFQALEVPVSLRWVLVLGTDYFRASRPVIVRTDGGLLSVFRRIGRTVTGRGKEGGDEALYGVLPRLGL
jgi:hypothetical protein